MSTATDFDWGMLEVDGIEEVIGRAARAVSREYSAVEYDDLCQEARVIVCAKPEMRAALEDGGLGRLHHRLKMDLLNIADSADRKVSKNFSFEEGHEYHYQSEGMSGEQSRDLYFAERNRETEEAREAHYWVDE